MDAGEITTKYPEDAFPGHAAWLDWPWKLHRIEKGDKIHFELYHLDDDPEESVNLIDQFPGRANDMQSHLEKWQGSVIRSLNGADY